MASCVCRHGCIAVVPDTGDLCDPCWKAGCVRASELISRAPAYPTDQADDIRAERDQARSDLAAERVASAEAARALEVATAERDKYKMEFIRVGLEKAAADKPGVEMIRLLKAAELGKEEGRKEYARALEVARKALEEILTEVRGRFSLGVTDCHLIDGIASRALRSMAGEKEGAA